jgi:hypothetical protein
MSRRRLSSPTAESCRAAQVCSFTCSKVEICRAAANSTNLRPLAVSAKVCARPLSSARSKVRTHVCLGR